MIGVSLPRCVFISLYLDRYEQFKTCKPLKYLKDGAIIMITFKILYQEVQRASFSWRPQNASLAWEFAYRINSTNHKLSMKNQITFSAWKPLQKNILAVKNLKRLDAKARISLHVRSQSFILSFIYLSYCVRVFRESIAHCSSVAWC